MPLLPQQIAPVDERQAALTEAHLSGRIGALMDYFLALRAETDAVLAPRLAAAAGKPYPYGRCTEINSDLFSRLAGRVKEPATDVDRILRDFVAQGESSERSGASCAVSISRTPSSSADCTWTSPTTPSW